MQALVVMVVVEVLLMVVVTITTGRMVNQEIQADLASQESIAGMGKWVNVEGFCGLLGLLLMAE